LIESKVEKYNPMPTGLQGVRRCTRKVQSIFHKFASSFRLGNLIGKGMPERIRSVGFAFLGLTAAAGLALVVLFAQMGFPLLSPVPLPGSPEPGSVSKAVPLEQGSEMGGIAAVDGSLAAPSPSGQRGTTGAGTDGKGKPRVDNSADQVSEPAPGDAPAGSDPVVTPPPPASPPPAPTTTEIPPAPTESSPAPVGSPASSPDTEAKPDKSTAVVSKPEKGGEKPAKPEAKPAKTKPAKPAKATSAKPAKPSKSEAAPAPEASYVPAPVSVPAEAGKAKEKEEEDKKSK
jgi:hypothetical protein